MIEETLRDWFPAVVAIAIIGFASLIRWFRKRPVKDPPADTPYKVYSTRYDIEIRAEDIAGQLDKISADHPKYWLGAHAPECTTAVERAIAHADEVARGDLLLGLPDNLSDFAISVLVDHSGSMKGETMQAVAPTVKAIAGVLTGKGATVELLGYTTAGWRGGYARQRWINDRKPKRPGRLCALMHIIYKSANDESISENAFAAMLNPGILYENIDGEAIEWAEHRLLVLPKKHKLLIVISDGAPVDDSTLMQNGPSILWWHIKQVIGRIESEQNIVLGAVGVNYRVDGFYANSACAQDLSDLPDVAAATVKRMIALATNENE